MESRRDETAALVDWADAGAKAFFIGAKSFLALLGR
jgi:hypothetical protein